MAKFLVLVDISVERAFLFIKGPYYTDKDPWAVQSALPLELSVPIAAVNVLSVITMT
jgi:hypothetical protein